MFFARFHGSSFHGGHGGGGPTTPVEVLIMGILLTIAGVAGLLNPGMWTDDAENKGSSRLGVQLICGVLLIGGLFFVGVALYLVHLAHRWF